MDAVRIAREYSTPVVILTDQAIATRIEAFEEPNLKEICQDITPDLSAVEDHKPYDLSAANGVSKHLAPGTPIRSGKYPVITGLEHDESGHPTGSPKMHKDMTAKRRRKLQALAESLPTPKVYGAQEGDVLIVGWGSTQGPIQEAVDRVKKDGDNWAALHIRNINPLPNGLEQIFAKYKHVLVAEIKDEGLYGYGQLAGILRARYCDPKIRGINKTDGLTFKIKEIVQRVREAIA
jgi:2-oxoglutarate ferredoxin oxidoreductase subunit alpha